MTPTTDQPVKWVLRHNGTRAIAFEADCLECSEDVLRKPTLGAVDEWIMAHFDKTGHATYYRMQGGYVEVAPNEKVMDGKAPRSVLKLVKEEPP